MTNILTKNLDINDFFINGQLDKIAEISENLSENSKLTEIDNVRMSDNDYAIVLKSMNGKDYPKYAMNNSGTTELNMAFLESEMDTLPEELVKKAAANLTASANYFNISIPDKLQPYNSSVLEDRVLNVADLSYDKYITKIAEIEPIPEYSIFALKGKYPIDDKTSITKSASWFSRNYNKLDIDEQLEFTGNLLKQASIENVDVSEDLGYFNGLDQDTFNPDLKLHFGVRKSYLEDGTDRPDIMDDLWSQREEIGALKTAYVLEAIDKEYRLDDLYGLKIENPVHTVLGQLVKEASADFEGTTVTLTKLSHLDINDLNEIVGVNVAPELQDESGLILFNSLPYPMKQQISGLIND